ncbi:MAG: UDP-glucose 4-epimerase GalE [Blastocatellia bacterium]|nr:UDP-glucose 4-epimerase GalE [Blastocatellia bacterium]
MNILVTGGAGYIGSVVVDETLRAGHQTVVYDNLVKGHREMVSPDAIFVEGDLFDRTLLEQTFRDNRIEAVIHMAAYSLVGESVADPAKYYMNNVVAGISLIDTMRGCDISKIVFSSTAAVYGEPEKQPIEEGDRTAPTNPYGDTKLAFEQALGAYERSYGLRYASLRYFNAAGASERCGEMHDPETHLIPLVLQVAAGERVAIDIFGDDYPTQDGTCVRDYIHVIDLARAHIQALAILDNRSSIFNLGCGGEGYSVKEVVDAARAVTGKDIPVRVAERRAGDPAVLIASSERIRAELGWQPEFQDLRVIIESAWRWNEGRKRAVGG